LKNDLAKQVPNAAEGQDQLAKIGDFGGGETVSGHTVLNPRENTEFLKPKYAMEPSNAVDSIL
jgi:hypothetical protein